MPTQRIEKVRELASRLNLPVVKDGLHGLLMEAEEAGMTHLEFLELVLGREAASKDEKARKRRVSQACLPAAGLTLDSYDVDFNGCVSGKELRVMAELKWIEGHYNMLFLGPPGTGKTHLASALGLKAAEDGYQVSYTGMTELLDLLKTEEAVNKSKSRLKRIRASSLLIVDDVGICSANRKETAMFFGLLAELHGRCSIIITSNKGVGEWGDVFEDESVLTSGLDRLMYKCEVKQFSGKSYRLENRRGFLEDAGQSGSAS